MKSTHSETSTYQGMTRLQYDGRHYVALGQWTDAQMITAIEQARRSTPTPTGGK